MSKAIEITKKNINETKEGVVFLDFWAPWCGPCRMLSPVIDELVDEFDGKAKICKVNVDEQSELATEYGVRSIPALYIIKDGKIKNSMIGATSKEVLSESIKKYL